MAKPYEESKIYQTRICQVSELNPALQKYLQFQISDNEKILYCVEGQAKLPDSIFYYACILTQNEVISVTSDIVPGSGGIMSGNYSHVVLVEEKNYHSRNKNTCLRYFLIGRYRRIPHR